MGAERGTRHKRSSSLSDQCQSLLSREPLSTADDRTSLANHGTTARANGSPPLLKPRNALSGPHQVKHCHVAVSQVGHSSPSVDVPKQKTAQGRFLPPVNAPRQHYRPQESSEDVNTLEELNPSIVTLVPHLDFGSPLPRQGKAKPRKLLPGLLAAGEAAPPLADVALSQQSPAARAPFPLEGRPDNKQSICRNTKASSRYAASQGDDSRAASNTCSRNDCLPDCKPSATAAADSQNDAQVVSPEKSASSSPRKRRPRPTASLSARESTLKPLPFQSVFGMSVDEMLDTAHVSSGRQGSSSKPKLISKRVTQLAAKLDPSGNSKADPSATSRIGNSRTSTTEQMLTEDASTNGDDTTGQASQRVQEALSQPLSVQKYPNRRELKMEDRSTTFGSGKFVVNDFLASLGTS